MNILKYTFQSGNDFHAILKCEHCGHEGELKSGYHDGFYHGSVLPSIICKECKKNRAGTDRNLEGVNGRTEV